MGPIQSSINQGIGAFGIMTAMNPAFKEHVEAKQLKKAIPGIQERHEQAMITGAEHGGTEEEMEEKALQASAGTSAEYYEKAKRLFQLQPTEENYKIFQQANADYKATQSLEARTYARRRQQERRQKLRDQGGKE